MLGKLMKYEFKATSRMLLPINGAMLLFALINRLFMELNFFQTGIWRFLPLPPSWRSCTSW